MPVSRQLPTQTANDLVHNLRPYTFHGVELTIRNSHGVGDCPFCGREGKFCVATDSGMWRCVVCGTGSTKGGGNAFTFLRLLHTASVAATTPEFRTTIAQDRRLLSEDTVAAWGVCMGYGQSWLIPGYGPDGRLDQLYRRVRIKDGKGLEGDWAWRLLPTPGVWPDGKVHALHLPNGDFDPARPNLLVMEGVWDAMALWEVAAKSDTNIVAVPGCNVWRDEWSAMCRGKHVTLMFDSDHPRETVPGSGRTFRAGYDGMCRVAKRLSGVAASVRWLKWGEEFYNRHTPSGWDVRDELSGATTLLGRQEVLAALMEQVELVPTDIFTPHHLNGSAPSANVVAHVTPDVEPIPCCKWSDCEDAWKIALEWRSELGDALAVMLAVAASTRQAGDNQLFLQVVGDPGSAKTRLCKGLLVSKTCKLILHLKSFHSGFKGEDGKDCSLVSRINGMCLITPEADALAIGMSWDQLNSQMRQIFDGDSGHTYGNSSEDVHYKGLRCPWIQAGTPALMDKDQSRLGDRFLRIRIEEPTESTKQLILLRALRNERAAVLETSNGTEASIIPPKLQKAYALTGGYVDWLRANVEEQIQLVEMDDAAEQWCIDLASLTADARARPNMDPKKTETHHTKELPSRLVGQFGRLALCLAVVFNRKSVDADVLRVVRRVALDTAHGHTLDIMRWLSSKNPKGDGRTYQEYGGLTVETLGVWLDMTTEKAQHYLSFLRKVGVIELREVRQTHGTWLLTDRVYALYLKVMMLGGMYAKT